jgi:proteasome assembly chaperone (PAC2) family protein
LAITTAEGGTRSPINELYYGRSQDGGCDMVIWYGNTQALTTAGQYELCGRVLDLAQELGCEYVITLGGFRQEEVKSPPQVYSAASDLETMSKVLALGTKVMVGQVFGIAGITVGLARLRGIKSFSLLVETLGTYPDMEATRYALMNLNKFLGMNIDLSRLDIAVTETKKVLESFGLIRTVTEEKKKEEQQFRWSI